MQSPGVRAAHVAEMDVASFIAHLGRPGTTLLLLLQLYGLLVTKFPAKQWGVGYCWWVALGLAEALGEYRTQSCWWREPIFA